MRTNSRLVGISVLIFAGAAGCGSPVAPLNVPSRIPETDPDNFSELWKAAQTIAVGEVRSSRQVGDAVPYKAPDGTAVSIQPVMLAVQDVRVIRGTPEALRQTDEVACTQLSWGDQLFMKGRPLQREDPPGTYLLFLGKIGKTCAVDVVRSRYRIASRGSKGGASAAETVADLLMGHGVQRDMRLVSDAAYLFRAIQFSEWLVGYQATLERIQGLVDNVADTPGGAAVCLNAADSIPFADGCVDDARIKRLADSKQTQRMKGIVEGRKHREQEMVWWLANRADEWINEQTQIGGAVTRQEYLRFLRRNASPAVRTLAGKLLQQETQF